MRLPISVPPTPTSNISPAGVHIGGERAVNLMVAQHRWGRAASGATLLLPVLILPKLPTLPEQLFMGSEII